MSRAGHSTLREQAFSVQGLLDVVPNLWAWIVHGQEQLRLFSDIHQILNQRRARRARLQMLFFVGFATRFNDIRQYFLELLAIHCLHPLPTYFAGGPNTLSRLSRPKIGVWTSLTAQPASVFYLREAFSALLSFNKSRSFMRALCNCDLLFPIEHPIISAISLCSYPSTSCSTKIIL